MRAGIVFVIVEGRALVKTCCAVGRTVKDINITYVIVMKGIIYIICHHLSLSNADFLVTDVAS